MKLARILGASDQELSNARTLNLEAHMIVRSFLASVTLLLQIGLLRSADACSCEPEKLSVSLKRAKIVFRGKIVATTRRQIDADCKSQGCISEYTYEVSVLGVWKGKLKSKVIIDGGTGGGECTLGDLGDKVDWVFITDSDGAQPITVHLCGGSTPASKRQVAKVTKLLGAPRPPSK